MRYDCAIVDSNILIYCIENSIDLLKEVSRVLELSKIFIPASVDRELSGLARSNQSAAMAVEIFKGIQRLPNDGNGDDAIVSTAVRSGCAVITNDRELKNKLKGMGIPTYSLRRYGRIERS